MVGIIPAAGLGTRLREISQGRPKELLPVCGKPMIDWTVEELEQSGVSEIVVIINPVKEEIKEYLCKNALRTPLTVGGEYPFWGSRGFKGESRKLSGLPLKFVYQPEPYGLAGAIYRCKDLVRDSEFVVSLPDNIFTSTQLSETLPIIRLLQVAKEYKKSVIALMKLESNRARYFGNCGRISCRELLSNVFEITRLWDKKPGYFSTHGKPWVLRYFSRYVFQSSVFYYIDRCRSELASRSYKGEFDDIPVLQDMVKSGDLLGVLVDGKVFDVGNLRGYKFANEWLKMGQ